MKGFKFLTLLLPGVLFLTACQKEFTGEATTATTAKGSLQKDSTGACMPGSVSGVFTKDSLLKASNYVDITVKITQTGSYSINTDIVNGYSFSGEGDVSVIGFNTIRLVGTGRPILAGINVFKVAFDSSICEFKVVVNGSGSGGGGGGATPNFIKANIDGAIIVSTFNLGDTAVFDNTSLPGYSGYGINGSDSAGTVIQIGVGVPGVTGPTTGIAYNVNQSFTTAVVLGKYKDTLLNNYTATTMAMNPMPYFTVTVTSVTANRITGTFSGALFKDGTGPAKITFTNGSFSVPKQ